MNIMIKRNENKCDEKVNSKFKIKTTLNLDES